MGGTCLVLAVAAATAAAVQGGAAAGAARAGAPTVVVIGGGHAGTEAVAAAARCGARALLVTQRLDTIGEMSCNPSIGGIGKGHLVREVDALDGLMGRLIDQAGIHFRMLNERKGPAVRGPRAQADRDIYREATQAALAAYDGVELVEGSVDEILFDELARGPAPVVRGVRLADGAELRADAVVLTAGTFLRGVVHVGSDSQPAGRYVCSEAREVEPPAGALAESLARLHLPLARLKTGTPPRLDGRTIEWGALEPQPSAAPPEPFSFVARARGEPVALVDSLVECYRTATNARTHEIVRAHAHELPRYEGPGPRYCPSLAAKVERFAARQSHGVWLEPEGLRSHLVYPNGLSSAFPEDVQERVIRSIAGLERAEIVRPAYDVEYDYVDPRAVRHSLGARAAAGLYLAGQVLGTTGYEEAAALGLLAGANAALCALGRPPLVLSRADGYAGVLVDDLVGAGTSEPYRMFTSRAEYRLALRADNADLRLTELGAAAGVVVDAERLELARRKARGAAEAGAALARTRLPAAAWAAAGVGLKPDGAPRTGAEVLAMPDSTLERVEAVLVQQGALPAHGIEPLAREEVAISGKYANYLQRQRDEVERWRAHEGTPIPADLDYAALPSLSAEEVEKLSAERPPTIGAAGRIAGVTPNSVTYLLAHLRTRGRRSARAPGGAALERPRASPPP